MGSYTGIDNLEVMREAENYNRFLVDLVLSQAQPGDRIVDFGAGAGTFAAPVMAAGRDVVCVESDSTLGAHLSSKGLAVLGDLDQVSDASIDYLYSLNVLEHIADDAAMAARWWRALRPGGRLLVYVPAFEMLFSSMDRKVGHHRRYRLGGLRQILAAAGFRVVQGRYADSLGFVATMLFKLIDSGSGDVNRRMLRLYDRAAFPASRALDRVVGRFIGKNVYVVAVKPR
jgi:SAM-dependent methyltransferase